ncbi:hypothetical protein ACWGXJ_04300 [Paenibacillus sp. S33]
MAFRRFYHSADRPALLTMLGDVLTPINAPTPGIAADIVRLQKQAGADLIKVGGVTPDVFKAIQSETNRLNMPLVGHVLSDMDLKEVAQHGFRSVEHFGINNGSLISSSTDEDMLRAQAKRIPACSTNKSSLNQNNNSSSSSNKISDTSVPTITSSAPITPSESKPENNKSLAMEAYKIVLQNKIEFYSIETKKKVYLNDFLTNSTFAAQISKQSFDIAG